MAPAPPAPASSSQEQSLSSLRPERGFRFLPCCHAVVRPVFKTGFVISLSTPPPPGFLLFPSKCASEDPLCALRRAGSGKAGHSLIPAPGDGGLGLGVARASGRPAEHDGCIGGEGLPSPAWGQGPLGDSRSKVTSARDSGCRWDCGAGSFPGLPFFSPTLTSLSAKLLLILEKKIFFFNSFIEVWGKS